MGAKDFVKDFLEWRANSRMTSEEKAYAEELETDRQERWKDADNWIDLDDDEMLPTFDCIILLRDTNCKRYLVARYEFETIYPIPYSSGEEYNDDGGWDWHFYDTETDQEYDADEICMTYSQLMVIKRIYSDNF